MFHLTALVTCLAILFYFFTSIQVSKARVAFGIKAPAIIGQSGFRAGVSRQMNTLEWMPIFLPSLWLFAIYISDRRRRARPGLDRRPHPLYDRLFASRQQRGTGFGIQAARGRILWLARLRHRYLAS